MLSPHLSLERYRVVLGALYGFYRPIEVEVAKLAPAAAPLGFSLRARADLLRRDLLALGTSSSAIDALPRCAELPRLALPEHMAGSLYVLEGAALGGRIVARALADNLAIDGDGGASFFVGDAQETTARWKRVLLWLDEFDDGLDAVVAAACETFLTLGRWLQTQGASR